VALSQRGTLVFSFRSATVFRKGTVVKLNYPINVAETDLVPGSWFPFGVGIDCHKAMVWACVLRPDYHSNQQSRSRARFATTPSDLFRMRQWLESLVPAGDRRVLVESTSTYHFPILHALPGWRPTVINPKLVVRQNARPIAGTHKCWLIIAWWALFVHT
jgi:hypothetical protein